MEANWKALIVSLFVLLFIVAGAALGEEAKVVFYIPFEGNLIAVTPERETEPQSGVVLQEDLSQSVTIGELAQGKYEKIGGEQLEATGDARIEFVPGLSGGKAARLRTMITYPAPWIKNQK